MAYKWNESSLMQAAEVLAIVNWRVLGTDPEKIAESIRSTFENEFPVPTFFGTGGWYVTAFPSAGVPGDYSCNVSVAAFAVQGYLKENKKPVQLPSAVGNMHQTYQNFDYYRRNNMRALDMAGYWWEIDEDTYNHFLNCMPPVYRPYGFSMIEMLTGSISSYFFHINGKFYCAYVDWRTPNAATVAIGWTEGK